MNRLLILFSAILTGLSIIGCGTAAKETQMRSQSDKTDVFTAVKDGDIVPIVFALLKLLHDVGYTIVMVTHNKPILFILKTAVGRVGLGDFARFSLPLSAKWSVKQP